MKVEYHQDGKVAYFNGYRFLKDARTGYYLSTKMIDGKRMRLHRYVWETFNGEVPDGYHVHHIDGNKGHNDIENLTLIKSSEHAQLHGQLLSNDPVTVKKRIDNLTNNARPKATEWHKSEVGRKWHKEHYEEFKAALYQKVTKVCEQCGKEYEGTPGKGQRFCSNACKSAWRRKMGIDNEERFCEVCGKSFTANKYAKTRFCSPECARQYKRDRAV